MPRVSRLTSARGTYSKGRTQQPLRPHLELASTGGYGGGDPHAVAAQGGDRSSHVHGDALVGEHPGDDLAGFGFLRRASRSSASTTVTRTPRRANSWACSRPI